LARVEHATRNEDRPNEMEHLEHQRRSEQLALVELHQPDQRVRVEYPKLPRS
jgi:hypothetical protein